MGSGFENHVDFGSDSTGCAIGSPSRAFGPLVAKALQCSAGIGNNPLAERTGSATGDDRVGVWCEKIGPSREGDKRPANGLDINLACKCCPAGIERDGVG